MELRYITKNNERVLQFRTQIQVPDYSTEKHVPKMVWSDWKDVPVVDETK